MRGLSAKKSRLKERDAFLAKAAPEAVVAAVSTAGESAVVVEG
jgi:hypothetical protein